MNIDNKFYPSLIIQAAMPTGISAILISEKYNFETKNSFHNYNYNNNFNCNNTLFNLFIKIKSNIFYL